jgi:hypothetical protein
MGCRYTVLSRIICQRYIIAIPSTLRIGDLFGHFFTDPTPVDFIYEY